MQGALLVPFSVACEAVPSQCMHKAAMPSGAHPSLKQVEGLPSDAKKTAMAAALAQNVPAAMLSDPELR